MIYNALLNKIEESKFSNEIEGQWAAIQLKLDTFCPQYVNIGVVFQENESTPTVKIASNFNALRCLINDFDELQLSFLLDYFSENLRASSLESFISPSPTMRLSNPAFFSGINKNEIVEFLYSSSVITKEDKERKKNTFESKDNRAVRSSVFDKVKLLDPLSNNVYIYENSPLVLPDDNGHHHALDIPIRNQNCTGSLISGWYSKWSTIKMHYMEARMDVSTASTIYKNKPGLFMHRPSIYTGIEASDINKIDEGIDEMIWKLTKSNFMCISEVDEDLLAESIAKWAN
jgi:hypothetical protein